MKRQEYCLLKDLTVAIEAAAAATTTANDVRRSKSEYKELPCTLIEWRWNSVGSRAMKRVRQCSEACNGIYALGTFLFFSLYFILSTNTCTELVLFLCTTLYTSYKRYLSLDLPTYIHVHHVSLGYDLRGL